jgi:DNA-binding NarL/FixJ family response regulator
VQTIRILLADDHALFRRGLAGLLNQERGFTVIGEAADGAEAVRQALALRPDLVLMDIHMPGTDGLQATRQIVAALPATRVVMLTVSEQDRDLFEAIKAGAHGYLLKTVDPERLFGLLRGVSRGEAPLSGATAARILRQFADRAAGTGGAALGEDLTAREREVLELLVAGQTNKEIGSRLKIAENTVKNHLKSILAKLHLDNRVQAATLALRQGLVPPPPRPPAP